MKTRSNSQQNINLDTTISFKNGASGSKPTALAGRLTKVKFGSVTVEARAPTNAMLTKNITSGQDALLRATSKIVRPGVSLDQRPEIPVYHADPSVPGRIIRELRGKCQSGVFVDGKFRVAK